MCTPDSEQKKNYKNESKYAAIKTDQSKKKWNRFRRWATWNIYAYLILIDEI